MNINQIFNPQFVFVIFVCFLTVYHSSIETCLDHNFMVSLPFSSSMPAFSFVRKEKKSPFILFCYLSRISK